MSEVNEEDFELILAAVRQWVRTRVVPRDVAEEGLPTARSGRGGQGEDDGLLRH
jgi:hypothetical protein